MWTGGGGVVDGVTYIYQQVRYAKPLNSSTCSQCLSRYFYAKV